MQPIHPSLGKPIFSADIATLESTLPDAQWIDLREYENYKEGHIDSARNFPMPDFQSLSFEILQNSQTPYILYCYSGYTASVYASYLVEMGAENIYYFDESFEVLVNAYNAKKS